MFTRSQEECVADFYTPYLLVELTSHSNLIVQNAFNLTMNPNDDYSELASCTSCCVKEDKSNYWTAVVYFKHNNGTYIRVPQKPNFEVGNTTGGFTVYYISGYPPFQHTYAFARGFRMMVGTPTLRAEKKRSLDDVSSYASTFRCWDFEEQNDPQYPYIGTNRHPPGMSPNDTVGFPSRYCPNGVRSTIIFPSCWDGASLDTKDHKSHMTYPEGPVDPIFGIIWNNGSCPATHPVKVPTVQYQVVWDTSPFKDMWPTDGRQPLVLSNGDPTGFGQHADYVFGWEGSSLQTAMDNCKDQKGDPQLCSDYLTILTDDEMNQCKKEVEIDEVVEGEYIAALPGCNPEQAGPGPATAVTGCTAVSTTISRGAGTTTTRYTQTRVGSVQPTSTYPAPTSTVTHVA
ncbi:hypothetical protein D9611_013014 [Ephemerocybe angulata]|uniref:DUF1996 domain-containing protein n=1 Tax=Ephemerocybe angulata TaxID=980116 RepID=A0A8H5AUM3_9AGAR|nr:hypothetical protein D9611_013014 [Tulosesus angulatus]